MTEIYLAEIFIFNKSTKYNNVYPEHPYTKYNHFGLYDNQ